MDKMEGVQGIYAFLEHLVSDDEELGEDAPEEKKELEKVD
jgi:hypothetical protein